MSLPLPLPELSTDELAHTARVAVRLQQEIVAAGGWISFARYMQIALYEPGLGYYSAGAAKLGPGGDFVTAPEVAPVFSCCVAAQCSEILYRIGGGSVLELGAGSGAMAAGILAEMARLECLPREYLILDVSADLRERQRATLDAAVPGLVDRVRWLDALPEDFEGTVVANEVIDAMPVERFLIRSGAVHALGVACRGEGFEWSERPAPDALAALVRRIEQETGESLPEGFVSEINTGLGPWIAAVGRALSRGVVLFIDYGLPRREYYAAERSSGTMLCHFRHRFHDDPFLYPGLQDIGSWVDFTAVAEAGVAAGLELAGYTTQAHFLIGNGIGDYVAAAGELEITQRLNISRQVMLLTLPGEMGERFKAIALQKQCPGPLRGFSTRDLGHLL